LYDCRLRNHVVDEVQLVRCCTNQRTLIVISEIWVGLSFGSEDSKAEVLKRQLVGRLELSSEMIAFTYKKTSKFELATISLAANTGAHREQT